MDTYEPLATTNIATDALEARRGAGKFRALRRWIGAWFGVCADYHATAAKYEQLSRLSDAELTRRGLSRSTLARDLCRDCERDVGY